MVVLQDLYLYLVPEFYYLRRVRDLAPRHVAQMHKTVHSAEVNESAVVSHVLYHALDLVPFLYPLESFLPLGVPLFFEYYPARHYDVLFRPAEFYHPELELLALDRGRVLDRLKVNLRIRKERDNAFYVNVEAAVYRPRDPALYLGVGASGFFQFVKSL